MSKDRQEQAGALLSAEEIARNQAERENSPPPVSGGQGPAMPPKMTAYQYLGRAPQAAGIGELIRSLYRTEVMSFGEWENTVGTLLKRQVR